MELVLTQETRVRVRELASEQGDKRIAYLLESAPRGPVVIRGEQDIRAIQELCATDPQCKIAARVHSMGTTLLEGAP